MRLLDRYLLRELLIPLGYCLCGFLLFWIAFDLFGEIGDFQKNGLGPVEIAQYYLVTTPEFLVLVLPIALLLALLYSLTNHARHHEITAIRSAGVSLWRLSLPYFAVGLLISLASFVINEKWVPDSSDRAEEIMNRHAPPKAGALGRNKVRHLGFTNARDGRIWQIGIYDSETGEMTNPQVFWTQPDQSRVWLKADRGDYTNGVWTFYNVYVAKEALETNALAVPVLETNVLVVPQFTETPELIRSEIKISNRLVLARARRADVPLTEIINYLRLHPNPAPSERSWLYTKLQGRLASPWTCLVVVLIAIPFGAASGRRNVFVGVASSILICFIYFVLQQVTLALGTGGYVPPWLAAWFPNLSFGLVGLWMTASVR